MLIKWNSPLKVINYFTRTEVENIVKYLAFMFFILAFTVNPSAVGFSDTFFSGDVCLVVTAVAIVCSSSNRCVNAKLLL